MATRLKNIVVVQNAAPGVTTVAHGLNVDGVGAVPDKVEASSAGSFEVAADATNLTITNLGGAAADVSVYVEHWHTVERVFGASQTTALTPQPFVSTGSAGAAGSNGLRFADDGTLLDVYVDAANGDDGNSGLSTAAALQTVQAVYRKFPQFTFQNSRIRVNLAGVGGFGANATDVLDYDIATILVGGEGQAYSNTFAYVGPEMVPYQPSTGPATAALDATPAVAVAGGSPSAGGTRSTRFDFTTAAPGWTAGDLAGRYLRITRGGNKVIYEAPIAANTANTITVRINGVAPVIQNTDVATIVWPGARFTNSIHADDFDWVTIRGRATSQFDDYADSPGPTFQRLGWTTGAILANSQEISFDRCMLEYFYGQNSSGNFVNCTAQQLNFFGFMTGPWVAIPKASGAGDPIDVDKLIEVQVYGEFAYVDLTGFYGQSYYLSYLGLAIDGAATGPVIEIGYGSALLCCDYGAAFPRAAIQGIITGGAGPAISCFGGGFADLSGNVATGAGYTSLYASPGGDPLRLGDGAITADYGSGVGDWEEAAGYNGVLYSAPAAAARRHPNSVIYAR